MNNNRSAITASLLLVAFILTSVWLITQYSEKERERDLQAWQDKLSIIAEAKKRTIENWLKQKTDSLKELAANPLVQIYLSIDEESSSLSEAQRGQAGHLRNLLMATAKKLGVSNPRQSTNTGQEASKGMAIVDRAGRARLATRGFPAGADEVSKAVKLALQLKRPVVHGIYEDEAGRPKLVIAVPVSPVQMTGSDAFVGAVVVVIDPEQELYGIVSEQWLTTRSDESSLVMGDKFSTTYITPLRGKYRLFHQVPISNANNAANFARERLSDFAIKRNYQSEEVLITSRVIANTPWILVQKIDVDEALRDSDAHRDFIYTVFMLAVFIITVSLIAVWRHSTSLRLQKVSDRLSARTDLLNAVTDNIQDHIFLLDHNDRLVFVNGALATAADIVAADVRGKALNHIFSAEASQMLLALDGTDAAGNEVCTLQLNAVSYTYHAAVVKLESGAYRTSRLFVLHDISSLQEAQIKHQQLLEGVISTLVRVTDMHDPFCANHSERTRQVAIAIAEAMHLDDAQKQTLGMAAYLANIGKLNLPKELLTKMEPLTAEEEELMRNNVHDTLNILDALVFEGPVLEVIKQKNEYLDGSGYPDGLSGDAILPESRILAVANAFVAMSSARAYREGKPIKEVLNMLLQDSDKQYDRAVVAALFHIAESRDDWADWQTVK